MFYGRATTSQTGALSKMFKLASYPPKPNQPNPAPCGNPSQHS